MLIHVSITGRKKNKIIPKGLREQWERDRAKKAKQKHLREQEQYAAPDSFGARKGNKKKKVHKARLAAALASPMSLETVVALMRQFVTDIEGACTHHLPPMGQGMRKTVHELANAFKLDSKSHGERNARRNATNPAHIYTPLSLCNLRKKLRCSCQGMILPLQASLQHIITSQSKSTSSQVARTVVCRSRQKRANLKHSPLCPHLTQSTCLSQLLAHPSLHHCYLDEVNPSPQSRLSHVFQYTNLWPTF